MGDLFLILIGVIRGGIGAWMILLAVERGRFARPYGNGWLRRDKDPKAFRTRLWTDSLLTAGRHADAAFPRTRRRTSAAIRPRPRPRSRRISSPPAQFIPPVAHPVLQQCSGTRFSFLKQHGMG
jgi:hypothetical protein